MSQHAQDPERRSSATLQEPRLSPDASAEGAAGTGPRGPILWLLALAVLLRLLPAMNNSLWLDELHTFHHGSADSLAALLTGLRLDNHPPLSFFFVRVLSPQEGGHELLLRLPSVIAGVLTVLVTWRLALQLPGTSQRVVATALVAVSTLLITTSAEARMYALLALLTLLWLDLALRWVDRGSHLWSLAAVSWLGLHTHYHFIHALAVLGPLLIVLTPASRRRGLLLPGLVLALAALPWYAYGFATQLGHALPPGGQMVTPVHLLAALGHLVLHRSSLGAPLTPLFVATAAVALLGGAAGALHLYRRGGRARSAACLLGAAAFALPVWTALVAAMFPRAGFHWNYLAGSAAPLALLIAVHADGRLARRLALAWLVLLSTFLSLLVATAPSMEDYRAATRVALSQAREGDVILGADLQPTLFSQGQALRYYLSRLERPTLRTSGPSPTLLAVNPDLTIADLPALASAPRALLIGRSLEPGMPVLLQLRARFPNEAVQRFGDGIFLHTFTRE